MTDSHTLHVAALLVAGAVLYGAFQARGYIAGPSLVIESPQAYQTLSEDMLFVRGTARNVSKVTLNGEHIFTNERGDFSERLLVPNGYAILVVAAENRFGRRTETRIPFYGVPPEPGRTTHASTSPPEELSETSVTLTKR